MDKGIIFAKKAVPMMLCYLQPCISYTRHRSMILPSLLAGSVSLNADSCSFECPHHCLVDLNELKVK